MSLVELSNIQNDVSVVLLFTPEEVMEVFVYDRMIKSLGTTREYIQELKSVKDAHSAEINGTIVPFGCSTWVFKVNLDKNEKIIKEVKKNLISNKSGVYYLTTKKYYMYKNALEQFKNVKVLPLNMGYLSLEDMVFIYDSTVDKDKRISKELFSFFTENYSSDVGAVFNLYNALQYGEKITTKKDIVNICGIAGNTIPLFALNLLKSKINSDTNRSTKNIRDEKVLKNIDNGRKKIIKNKIKQVTDMLDVYNWRYIHTVTLSTIQAFCDLKILYINGHLYKKNLDYSQTEGYDSTQLARGMKYWYKIHELPMSELIHLRVELEKKVWSSKIDFEEFMYHYYK